MSLVLPARRASQPAWLRDPLWTRARMVPSLDLRFAETQSLRDKVSGQNLVTFTRASTATYVDSQGIIRTATTDAPRITHDPTTGRCLGLLVEEARTNLHLWSEDVSEWFTPLEVTASTDQTVAPDGTSTADQFLETTATSLHSRGSTAIVFVNGTTYTYSVFVKSINGRNYEIGFPLLFSGRFARFDLSAGTVQGTDAGVTATITWLANGWFRCTATSTCDLSAGGARVSNFINDGSARSYTGDTGSGLYIWGAQLEVGEFPTSYIKTEGSTATRAADIATMLSGLDLNSIRGMYAEFINPASGVRGIASLNDNTANERIALNTSGTDPLLTVVDGGVTQANIDAGSFTANTRTRLAARFNANDFAVSVNGSAEVVDTSGTMPTVDRLMIGRSQAGEYLNGPLARLTLWDRPPFNPQEITR
jgi:hypothetical protein